MADKFDYTHGAQGSKPPTALDFQTGDAIPPENFDWFWYNVIQAINGHASLLEEIDSDEDGVVDAANAATVADSANSVAGGDVTGEVAAAAVADEAKRMEVRTNDPNSPTNGRMWIRSDL